MSRKKISQETFDEVVRENIEDFEHSPQEALADAIDQFKKQGIDLSNIDTSGGVGRDEMLNELSTLALAAEAKDPTQILSAVEALSLLCSKSNTMYTRNVMFMKEKGGVNSLHIALEIDIDQRVLRTVIDFLNDLSKANEDIRDFFEPGGSDKLCRIIKAAAGAASAAMDNRDGVSDESKQLLLSAVRLARTVVKSENNKVAMMKAGVGIILTDLIVQKTSTNSEPAWCEILQECCQLVRGLCIHDDLRKDMSCAYENGRFFMRQSGFAQALMTLSGQFQQHPGVASAALLAARNLINTEDSVAVMAQHGAVELIKAVLAQQQQISPGSTSEPTPPPPPTSGTTTARAAATRAVASADEVVAESDRISLVKSAVALMRNICADDKRKDRVVSEGILDLLIATMGNELFAKDYLLMEHAIASLAQISLRSPSNSQRIVNTGRAVEIVAQSMRRFGDKCPALLRQGSLTIRNIAGRCPELRSVLLDAGLEDLLRAAGRYQDCVDEAYAALRDLGCEVQYVKVSADGKVEPMYQQFGAQQKLQFNPIYDEDVNFEERMVTESRAPFAPDTDLDDDDDDDIAASSTADVGTETTTCQQPHVHSEACAH